MDHWIDSVLRCSVFQVHWLKNGRPLEADSSGRLTLLPSGSLEITAVNIGDRAAYTCALDGLLASSPPADLRLNMDQSLAHAPSPPAFLTVPASTTKALAGSTVTLECAANGVPSPHITWLKVSDMVHYAKKPTLIALSLTISS